MGNSLTQEPTRARYRKRSNAGPPPHEKTPAARQPSFSFFDRQLSTPSVENRVALMESWQRTKQACHPTLAGVFILRQIFTRHPDFKLLFKLSEIPTDELEKSQAFMRHASVFTNVLELVLKHVQELETEVAPTLLILGKRHFYKHAIGFQIDYFETFSSAMLEYVVKYDSNVSHSMPLRAGWAYLISFMILKLKEGYLLESRHSSGVRHLFKRDET